MPEYLDLLKNKLTNNYKILNILVNNTIILKKLRTQNQLQKLKESIEFNQKEKESKREKEKEKEQEKEKKEET